MTHRKRAFDLVISVILCGALALPFVVILGLQMIAMGRPIFYPSERMAAPDRPFTLWKLRSMRVAPLDDGVCGGDKADRISCWGRILRASHMDEVPQLWNVLRGQISLVGPRPPLRRYVAEFPDLYLEVLQSRPGITGLATVVFHARERLLLDACTTADDTACVYARRCVARKARLDLIYLRNQSLTLDMLILVWTMAVLVDAIRPGGRSHGGSTRRTRLRRPAVLSKPSAPRHPTPSMQAAHGARP